MKKSNIFQVFAWNSRKQISYKEFITYDWQATLSSENSRTSIAYPAAFVYDFLANHKLFCIFWVESDGVDSYFFGTRRSYIRITHPFLL